METIIGLGNAGCNIAEKFAQYPQYNILRMDTKRRRGEGFKLIPEQDSHERYEKDCPSLKRFLKNVDDSCLLIVGGSGKISGMSLRVLEALRGKKIFVLYVQPDQDMLSHTASMQENVVFRVLQEYARSALVERIYLVNNSVVEEILGEVSISEYHNRINDLIVSTIHMVNVFSNSESVVGSFEEPIKTARISTLGIVNLESGEENLFFPLSMPREKLYYYAINNKKLDKERGLRKKIMTQLKDRLTDEEIHISYGIYPTEYSDDYVYTVAHATLIQGQDFSS